MKKNIAIGTDIGGSHITCAAIDLVSGAILRETITEREVNNQAQASIIISGWAEALTSVLEMVDIKQVKGIGIAMPGPFDYVRGISMNRGNAKYENLYGFSISDAISSSLDIPDDFLIRFMNDASAFAVGEAWTGSAKEFKRSLSITLGTGFGSAFVSERIPVVDGPDVPKLGCLYYLPYNGGMADDYFSTRGLVGRYKGKSGIELRGVKELSEQAVSDKIAEDIFNDFGSKLGKFLAPWLIGFRAEGMVIGGNISRAYKHFGKALEESLLREECDCIVKLSTLKEDAALIGSAYLLDDDFWTSVKHALPLM